MKNKNTREMWKNALSQIDEKYIAEAAEIAPDSENSARRAAPEKSGTGNLGFVFAAAAAMLATVIGVGFFFKGTGIEPLSPGSEGTNESFTQSDAPATTTAISDSGAITTSIIGEYAEITTAISPIDRESYQDWFREAEEIKEEYGRQMEEKEKEIEECEKLIDDLKKRLETEKFKEKSDYDKVKAELEIKTARLEYLTFELEQLKMDYNEQVLIIENNRKTYEQLYPTTEEINKPLTMEKLKALVSAKGKELTWSDFEQFEGEDIGSGLYIMEYPIDSAFKLVVGGVPTEKPWYIRLIYNVDESVFSITDNGADGFEEFVEKAGSYLTLTQLEKISEKNDISLDMLTDIEIKIENGAIYHDRDKHFYPMYLVFEADNRLVINTEARDPYGDDGILISLVFENFTGKWERTVDFRWTDSTILKGKLYSQKEMPSEIVIPEGITEIADSVFMDCTQIEKVTLPSTLKVIGAGAFKDCTNLKEINIPYGVTTIGERAFENCTSVYMVLPDTVTTIGDGAFSGCTQFDGTCKPSPIIPGTEDFTLIRPSDSTYITTQYSEGEEGHDGIDYAGELGDNIYAAADGVVIDVVDDKSDDGYGIHITIKHEHNGQELQTFYAHLNEAIVKKGDKVSRGDVIGYMGSTGWSTGPHVHFSLSVNGVTLNPNLYLKSVALKSPVSNGNILYGYGYKQLTGIIYNGEKGQDISAAADGTVSVAEYTNNHGDYVVIEHGNGYQTLYAHLDEIKVKAGETVTIGQTIGTMGDTGSTEGVNLYFELIRNGRQLNPMNYMIDIKSPVSNENILYGYGEYEGHKGIDYAGEKGQDISAAANGTVSLAGWSEGYGNCVVINHGNGYQTLYGHLDEIKVTVGEAVTTGQNIGTMGSTGVTTGVQLHFELLKNGENLNPADYISK